MVDVDPVQAAGRGVAVPAILLVDDNAAKRLAVRAMLAPLGRAVIEADSGREALRAVLRRNFALILMDVRMPALDGYETAKLIRQRSQSGLTPIIFVTSFGRDETEVATAYASGAVDFIFTPILPEVLRAKVSAFLDLFAQSQELQRSLESIMALNAALRDSHLRTQAVLDNVADGILTLDEEGVIESVNRSGSQLFGYPKDEPTGQPIACVIAPERREDFHGLDAVGPETDISTPRRATETLGLRQDGSTFPMEVERGEIKHGKRSVTIAFVRDITVRKAYTETLEHRALHDGLTGLANRTLFEEQLQWAIVSARRIHEPRALLVMDLDEFKQVNDTLGHDQGDALLKQVSQRLLATLREADAIARLGGDEFGILPSGATDRLAATEVAAKIRHACEPVFVINDVVVRVSPSIGIALFPEHGATMPELLRGADMAMYQAKRSGSGYAVCDSTHEKQTAQLRPRMVDLQRCIARDELVLHYQPKVNLATREIYGVEALVRWRHPERGLLLPADFMPEVERTQLIAPVTRWVLNQALHQQRMWRDEGLRLTMAVNVSTRSLRRTSSLLDTVAELTETWGTAPGQLTLELPEGALAETAAPEILARLHKMGERVSIDDFGTGYSSLASLQRLPLDEIEVNRSFVTGLATADDNAIIVRSTIDLAHNLGLTVVAEGVEDEVALDMLVGYRCENGQGHLFSSPCTADELTTWLIESPYGAAAVGA